MLCSFCDSLNLSTLLPLDISYDDEGDICTANINISDGFSHHSSFPSLLLSSRNGCTLCTLIARILAEKQTWCNEDRLYGSARGESEDELVVRLLTASSRTIFLYSVKGTEKDEGAGIWEMGIVATFNYREESAETAVPEAGIRRVDAFFWRALEVWREDGIRTADLKGYANYRTITPNPLSSHATGILKEWLESCQSCHMACKTHSLNVLPSRVIDIRDPCRPRLKSTKGESGQWVALSHCWGNSTTTVLTTDSLHEMEQAIPMASLPRNFRDSITVARLLTIDFLWIDSLCIIQDSIADWREQSAKMVDVYKNSTITIAATNAERSTDGFLRDRQLEVRCALKIEEETVSLILRPRIEWYGIPEIVGPLTQRAWVLQERLLPSRVLHFGGQQMMWQCRTKVLAEGYRDTDEVPGDEKPGGIESLIRAQIHYDPFAAQAPNEDSASNKIVAGTENQQFPLQGNIYNQWYRVVEMYAQLRLTNMTDKLPALAGVAQQIQSQTHDTYLSGIWESQFVRGLQWWYDPPEAMTRPERPRAPSWSWAALDRREKSKEDPDHNFNLGATFHSKYVPSVNEPSLLNYSPRLTEYGCLGCTSGSLTLLGLWRPVSMGGSINSVPLRYRSSYPTPITVEGDPAFTTGARIDTDEKPPDRTSLGCLQMGNQEYIGPKYSVERFVSALLLQKVEKAEDQGLRYVRIGLAVFPESLDLVEGWENRLVEIT